MKASEREVKVASPVLEGGQPKAAPPGPPPVLIFRCPNWQKDCDGTFDLVKDKTANDQAVWKKRGGERWIYLTTDKAWGVGGKSEFEQDFNCKNSYVFHPRTKGAPSPHLLPKGWMLYDGKAWREDPDVVALAQEAPADPTGADPPPAQVPAATAQGVAGLSSSVSSARSQGHAAGVAGLSSSVSSARSQGHGVGQIVAGLSSNVSSARSQQVDGGLLADTILSKDKVEDDDNNSWDEEGGGGDGFLPTLTEEQTMSMHSVLLLQASRGSDWQTDHQQSLSGADREAAKTSARDRAMNEFGFDDDEMGRDRANSWDARYDDGDGPSFLVNERGSTPPHPGKMAAPSQSLTDKRQLRGRRGPVAPVVETLEDSWVDRLEDGRALRKGQLDMEGLERCYPTPPPRAAPSAAEASSTSTLPIFKSKDLPEEELEQMRRAMRENRLQQLQQRRPLREERGKQGLGA
eukprot:g8610.t1